MKQLKRLMDVLAGYDSLAIAVSGGIDSTLLAHVADRVLSEKVRMVHAISPAVPAAATERVKLHSQQRSWRLELVDAGEFGDPRYRANPVDRCYFCKLNLYETITSLCDGPVASGTNCDDLGDYRPGLVAAKQHGVVHPYVDAGWAKRDIYDLASHFGIADLKALPAQPCLASRIETGIRIRSRDLSFVERVEEELHGRFGVSAILRCRVAHQGVVVELAQDLLDTHEAVSVSRHLAAFCAVEGRRFLGLRAYRRGAAFLRGVNT